MDMAGTFLGRLLPLLLLLLPSGLQEHLSPIVDSRPPACGIGELDEPPLHPIVLIAGVSCSELEARLTEAYRPSTPRCGALKGKGWFGAFGLGTNCSDFPAHHYLPCFMEQLRLVYDPADDDFRNLPGVETRVPNFGSTRGFYRNPEHAGWCLKALTRQLERAGYRDGDTLFGAPYDLRHAPPVPGHSSEVFSAYVRRLTGLIEDASAKNRGRKVILFGHSFGGTVALEFVRSTPMAWRRRHVKHLLLVAPLPAAGFLEPVRNLATGWGMSLACFPAATRQALRSMWRSFESAIVNFPSPAVFGDAPLVVTRDRNYSARDMEDLIAAIGCGACVEPFRRRAVPQAQVPPPMVPTTCINGVGNDTPERLVYWDSDFDKDPVVVNGDGDGSINLAAMLAFDEEMRQQPGQKRQYKSIKIIGARHSTTVSEEWALKRVMQEILEANRI